MTQCFKNFVALRSAKTELVFKQSSDLITRCLATLPNAPRRAVFHVMLTVILLCIRYVWPDIGHTAGPDVEDLPVDPSSVAN